MVCGATYRPKFSRPVHGSPGRQPEREGRVRAGASLGGVVTSPPFSLPTNGTHVTTERNQSTRSVADKRLAATACWWV